MKHKRLNFFYRLDSKQVRSTVQNFRLDSKRMKKKNCHENYCTVQYNNFMSDIHTVLQMLNFKCRCSRSLGALLLIILVKVFHIKRIFMCQKQQDLTVFTYGDISFKDSDSLRLDTKKKKKPYFDFYKIY
jgi:hypothetical protein